MHFCEYKGVTMYVILLSGGSGKRLWPLSNDLRSKQYIKILKDEKSGTNCSMIQRVWGQLKEEELTDNSIICASIAQIDSIKSQLGDVKIAKEPDRRDTFAAIALSCAYLKSKAGAKKDDAVCVIPVDPYTDQSYFKILKTLEGVLEKTKAEVVLMGATPTYPSSKYGYILPKKDGDDYIEVKGFKEKPTEEEATILIEQGSLWNCGVFCFQLKTILNKLSHYGLSPEYKEIFNNYDKLPKISFDYEVLEKSPHLVAVPFLGMWKDLGTWNTLTEEMENSTLGYVKEDSCENTNIINELEVPVIAMGLKDTIVVASLDGILVSDKHQSSYIKDVTKGFNLPPRFEERRWGCIKTLDIEQSDKVQTVTRKIILYKDMSSSYHYHKKRDEIWTIIKGSGEMIIEGELKQIQEGSVIHIHKGLRHAVKATTELEFIEIHLGEMVGDEDINRITFNWKEINRK